jgi:hypothetical protein
MTDTDCTAWLHLIPPELRPNLTCAYLHTGYYYLFIIFIAGKKLILFTLIFSYLRQGKAAASLSCERSLKRKSSRLENKYTLHVGMVETTINDINLLAGRSADYKGVLSPSSRTTYYGRKL